MDGSRSTTRETILEATRRAIGEAGFAGVSIAGVAQRAGVSRQTVYAHFGTREDLVSQAVSGRLAEVSGAYTDLLARADSPLEALVAVLVEVRGTIRRDPVLRTLTLTGPANPVFDPGAAARAREVAEALLVPLADRFPEIRDHVGEIADLGVHLGWSVVCLDHPDERTDADLRRFLERWLAPAFARF